MTTPQGHEPVGHGDVSGHHAGSAGAQVDEHDTHGHDEWMPLGPIDLMAWAAGILGILLGLAVVAAFAIAAAV